jgi:hypothetical protein
MPSLTILFHGRNVQLAVTFAIVNLEDHSKNNVSKEKQQKPPSKKKKKGKNLKTSRTIVVILHVPLGTYITHN